jgi:hypothetical protein
MTSLKQFETIVTLQLHVYDNFMVFKAPEASTQKSHRVIPPANKGIDK